MSPLCLGCLDVGAPPLWWGVWPGGEPALRACCAAACRVALASLCCDCKARERAGSSGAGRAAASHPPPAWCGAAPAHMLVVCGCPVHRPGMPTFQCATGSQACRWAEQGNPCWLTDDPVAVGSRTETQGLPPPHALLRIRAEQTRNCADAVPCEGVPLPLGVVGWQAAAALGGAGGF